MNQEPLALSHPCERCHEKEAEHETVVLHDSTWSRSLMLCTDCFSAEQDHIYEEVKDAKSKASE